MRIAKIGTIIWLLSFGLLFAADNHPFSQAPPGGLPAQSVPMFICFGFDDNARVEGVRWFTDFVRSRKNPAGTGNPATFDGKPIRATWFLTANYADDEGFIQAGSQTIPDVINAWKGLYQDGHEIANHTWNHPHGYGLALEDWKNQIKKTNDHLVKILGITPQEIKGFRTPYLEYNDGTLQALKEMGFTYDCSIEFGFNGWQPTNPETEGYWYSMTSPETHKKLWWPHTLDNGSPPGNSAKGNTTIPGLWEVPVFTYLLNDNSAVATGFDFNLWKVANKQRFVETLKHNFDLRRQGNRNPLTLNLHSDYYTQYNDDANKEFTQADYKQRQEAVEEFLDYALQFPETRIVTYDNMLSWMRAPVALSGTPTAKPVRPAASAFDPSVRFEAPDRLDLSLTAPGSYDLLVSTPDGRKVVKVSGSFPMGRTKVSLGRKLPVGIYFIQASSGTQSARRRVVLSP